MDYPWNVVALLFAAIIISLARAVVAWNFVYNLAFDMMLLALASACGLIALGLVLLHYA